ncbi:MAG: hypothetical protein JXM79_05425 [Sedimentisphaerales bacterium]|nr:hypothetical protein [Sedimentisphaerales bacterium]
MKSNDMVKVAFCILFSLLICMPVCAVQKSSLGLLWQTEPIFKTPESVLYDGKRDVVYVGNFNTEGGFLSPTKKRNTEYISKLTTTGKLLELKWIEGLDAPTGMTIHNDRLYVVERQNLVEVNIAKAEVVKRTPISGAGFANDVAFDKDGKGYISDNGAKSKTSLYRYSNNKIEPWMSAEQVKNPNGLYVDGQELIAYDDTTQSLVAINLTDKTIRKIAVINSDARAIGDGLVKINKTTYLVTAWSGPSWLVAADGTVTSLLDTTKTKLPNRQSNMSGIADEQLKNADSGYIPDKQLWLIPTFFGNKILAYKLNVP